MWLLLPFTILVTISARWRCEEALGAGASRRRCLICNMEYFGRGRCINAPRCPRRWYRQRYGEEDLMAARCQWARILKVRELWRQVRTFVWTGWAYKQFELLLLAIRTQTKGATPRGYHPPQLIVSDDGDDEAYRRQAFDPAVSRWASPNRLCRSPNRSCRPISLSADAVP